MIKTFLTRKVTVTLFNVYKVKRIKMEEEQQFTAFKSMFKPPTKPKQSVTTVAPTIESVDHMVLTVADIDRTIEFYTKALGMISSQFGEGRQALQFGQQKINLHQAGKEFTPHAKCPTAGSADICFVTLNPLENWIDHLENVNVEIVEGPVPRTGAVGPITSVYVRDPDSNLVEIASYGEV